MSDVLAWLLAPFAYEFMLRGLIVATLVGATCALLSCYLVLKGWSLMGDAVSHAVLPGIVAAAVLGLPLIIGAFAAGLACALSVGYVKNTSRVKEDAVMGVVFSGMFALGLVMFVKVDSDQHLTHVLFGDMLGVQWRDVVETGLITAPAIAFTLVRRRDLLLYCFDPAHARAVGLSTARLHFGLLVLLALTIVASLKAVGVVLVVAMLVTPGATAFLVTSRFDRMLMIASVSAISASVAGTIASFHLDAATGPLIVVVQAGLFALALGWATLKRRQQAMHPLTA
jgi:manganese/iron transport system permease protein